MPATTKRRPPLRTFRIQVEPVRAKTLAETRTVIVASRHGVEQVASEIQALYGIRCSKCDRPIHLAVKRRR